MSGKLVIFAAPSGSGKSTIVHHILNVFPQLVFSVSVTSRVPRGGEKEGRDYYFITEMEFRQKIESGELLEWQEVYPGKFYGTLRSDVERIWMEGKHVIFDIDVKGALNLKRQFGNRALAIFIDIPSPAELEKRLRERSTDSEENIKKRLEKAEYERKFAGDFDYILMNDELQKAFSGAENLVRNFLFN